MAYVEERNGAWRVRWKKVDGKYSGGTSVNETTGEPFATKEEAHQYGVDQETLIRLGLRKEKAAPITFEEWVKIWLPAQDLEPNTIATYTSLIRSHLAPVFNRRDLDSLYTEEIVAWELAIKAAGYKPRTARDARSILINILNDAVPRWIPYNPALRKRGKGRRGQRRIAAYEQATKAWPSPLETILVGERIAILTGQDSDFGMVVGAGFTGLRWGELGALQPDLVQDGIADIKWKIYELNGRFYWGRPKAGSIRQVDLPPFLAAMFERLAKGARRCNCENTENTETPWCDGSRNLLFLGEGQGHHSRSGFSSRFMRPAADGIWPAVGGKTPQPAVPVLINAADPWPGIPLSRRGDLRRPAALGVNSRSRKAELVEYAVGQGMGEVEARALTREGLLDLCVRRSRLSADAELVEWGPILPGLTPHGERHAHQTWMDDGPIKKAIKIERMGHEDLTMQGVYGHVTDSMRQDLIDYLEELWTTALQRRFELAPRSPVPLLDELLEPYRDGKVTSIISQYSPQKRRGRLTG